MTARERIAERIKNAYAAGYNDCAIRVVDMAANGHKGPDRMDEVAETETARILGIVRYELMGSSVFDAVVKEFPPENREYGEEDNEIVGAYINSVEAALVAAFSTIGDGHPAAFGPDDD